MEAGMIDDIRVLIVDQHPGLAQSLILGLPPRGPIRVLGPVADAPEALSLLAAEGAHVVVVEIDRPDGRGTEIVRAIRGGQPTVRVLASGGTPDLQSATRALAAGACGVLPPQRDRSLINVFRRALAGELVLPAAALPRLVDGLGSDARQLAEPERLATLTPREQEILRSLAGGMSTADVAQSLGISPLTVQSHVKNVLAKLGVHTKVEAVRVAWRHGLGVASRTA
jgi:DNA-binding NarL/FixJ family response regulator